MAVTSRISALGGGNVLVAIQGGHWARSKPTLQTRRSPATRLHDCFSLKQAQGLPHTRSIRALVTGPQSGAPADRAQDSVADPMKSATLTFPKGLHWVWNKAPPKVSLHQLPEPQDQTAAAWILNVIELIHWASFPLGFWVVYFIFAHTAEIAPHVGDDNSRVFLIMLGLLSQIYGGGISGNMMHEYEGWQVAPFRNPLALPESEPPSSDIDQIRVPKYNNAWLRAVAYKMLFTFQTFGLGCFSMAVFGINGWTEFLLLGSTAVALVGPQTMISLTRDFGPGDERPVLPLPWALLAVFAVNVVVNMVAYWQLFHVPIEQAWPPSLFPWLAGVPKFLVGLVSVLPPLAVGAGGAIEGYFAEANFNQWSHFGAFVILLLGLGLHGVFYWHLVYP